ncbi:FkbM family methyltransferase [Bradyrhizobium sp. 190]|uniref:FkbM family methyltransferase n=1 Tax=Bradyrhizobium sp. 190 TaxID=2782658 RepID=UPI001FF8EBFD|nr:FkbM family methyltransferase [Bradyrhizobium sp. 190]MCK1511904.1 FkbM family methyltransferase [Bradyrhizobium sp. 190]
MKTTHKIGAARAIYRAVHAGRTLLGRTDREIFVRDGISYDLDLSQGIDFAIYLGGMFEPSTAIALSKLTEPSSLVLDIGANIGAHTLRLAKLVGPKGRVLAFEPTDFAFRKLRRNLDLNPSLASRVDAFHCFLTATDGTVVPDAIYSSWPLVAEAGLHPKHLGREMQTDSAQARSLDSILAEHADRKVHLVKLDVDGFECDVLRGAPSLLRDARPTFVMELAPYVLDERGTSLDQLLSYFIPNGYIFYHERTQKRLPSTAKELQALVASGESMNVIARVT